MLRKKRRSSEVDQQNLGSIVVVVVENLFDFVAEVAAEPRDCSPVIDAAVKAAAAVAGHSGRPALLVAAPEDQRRTMKLVERQQNYFRLL